MDTPFMRINEAAAYLGVRPKTLYTGWRHRVPVSKIGGTLLYRRADLDAYVASCREKR